MVTKRKLGLIGLVLTGVMSAVGCVSAKHRMNYDIEELERKLHKSRAKAQREYKDGVEKENKETAEGVNASLNTEKRQAYGEAGKSDDEKLKQGYERADKLMKERKGKEAANLEAKQRARAFQTRTYSSNDHTRTSNENQGTWSLDIGAMQRSQKTGEQEPRVTSGPSVRVTYTDKNRWQAYFGYEQDSLSKTETSDAGNLRVNSTANTYSAGAGYRIINHPNHKVDVYGGLFNRTETNNINGVVGIRKVNDKYRESIIGGELGVRYTLENEAVGIGAFVAGEDPNLLGRNELNAKTGVKVGVFVTIKSIGKLFKSIFGGGK